MISFHYDVDWIEASDMPLLEEGVGLLGAVLGSTIIRIVPHVSIERSPSRVLLDSVQVVNAFSDYAIVTYNGKTLPVSINDETAFYVMYSNDISVILQRCGDPVLTVHPEEAQIFRNDLINSIIFDLKSHMPRLVDSYKRVLF